MTSPFAVRGVVEGFYGAFYTFPERNDLLRFMGQNGYTLYIYGPKNDRQHRARWWEPYPDEVMAQFAETVALAHECGVTFCYAIAPVSYADDGDFARLTDKLAPFLALGVRAFSLLVDDLAPPEPDDGHRGYEGYAAAHIALCNRLLAWLHNHDAACTLSMCPTDYHGTPPFSNYLRLLGAGLHPAIDIFYTGAHTCAPTITCADAEAVAEVLRRPPLIWDNYPVNDLSMRTELHLGPIQGRDAGLAGAVRGLVVNPMLQPEASKVALLTYADYLADPASYVPEESWERALRAVGGASYPHLRRFAAYARHSCLEPHADTRLAQLVGGLIDVLAQGVSSRGHPLARVIADEIDALDESCYALKHRASSLPLRRELLPWVEALESWAWLGRRALALLDALDAAAPATQALHMLDESLGEARAHSRRIGGDALLPLALLAHTRASDASACATPELALRR